MAPSSRRLVVALAALALTPSFDAQTLVAYRVGENSFHKFHRGVSPCATSIHLHTPDLGVEQCGLDHLFGEVAFDKLTDVVYMTDGVDVGAFDLNGGYVFSFRLPGVVAQGIGVDAENRLLWITTGGAFYAVNIPLSGCADTDTATIATGPHLVPFGFAGDIDWDPVSQSLFLVGSQHIFNLLPDGSPGPFQPQNGGAIPFDQACFTTAGPESIAVDTTSDHPGHVWVSNGINVASVLPNGTYGSTGGRTLTLDCFQIPDSLDHWIHGLAFVPEGNSYGSGVDPDGLAAPRQRAAGTPTSPGTMGHFLEDAVPGGTAYHVFATTPQCPAAFAFGVPFHVNPLNFWIQTTFPVLPSGQAFSTVPIPPGIPVGQEVFNQWVIVKPAGPSLLQTSNGVAVRFSAG